MKLIYNIREFPPQKDFLDPQTSTKFGLFHKFEVKLQFKAKNRWDEVDYLFLFDTGAYISYAPDVLIDLLHVPIMFEGYVYGILKDHKVKVKCSQVPFRFIDDNNQESKLMTAWFAFHPYEDGPRLLGMKTILETIGFNKPPNDTMLTLIIPDA